MAKTRNRAARTAWRPNVHTLSKLALLAPLACCEAPVANPDPRIYPATALVRVTRAPTADFNAADVRAVEVHEPAAVRRIRAALDMVPAEPLRGVRMIKFAADAAEYRIDFVDGDGKILGRHRIKGSYLDIASHPGWAFYSGEDRAFVALVQRLYAER
jgi:hypothetical protein